MRWNRRPDAAWKQRQLDYLEKNFERFSQTEAERRAVRERMAKWYDDIIANDWDEVERRARKSFRASRSGTLLPPEASDDQRIFALATRLEVLMPEHRRYMPGGDLYGENIPEDFWVLIGQFLAAQQPEFVTAFPGPMFGPGRPRGQPNKKTKMDVSKEAIRQRRRRQKKRDKYSS